MNKDQVKGKMTDIKGRVERQVSEWTGDNEGMAHGTSEQIKGKVQKGMGDLKEGAEDLKQRGNDALRDLERPSEDRNPEGREEERPRGKKVA